MAPYDHCVVIPLHDYNVNIKDVSHLPSGFDDFQDLDAEFTVGNIVGGTEMSNNGQGRERNNFTKLFSEK